MLNDEDFRNHLKSLESNLRTVSDVEANSRDFKTTVSNLERLRNELEASTKHQAIFVLLFVAHGCPESLNETTKELRDGQLVKIAEHIVADGMTSETQRGLLETE